MVTYVIYCGFECREQPIFLTTSWNPRFWTSGNYCRTQFGHISGPTHLVAGWIFVCFFWNILGLQEDRSDRACFFENFPTPLDRIPFVQIIEILFDQKPGVFGCRCIGGPVCVVCDCLFTIIWCHNKLCTCKSTKWYTISWFELKIEYTLKLWYYVVCAFSCLLNSGKIVTLLPNP